MNHAFSQLSALRGLRLHEKVAVSSTGDVSVEQPYMLRSVARRFRRDGFEATMQALNAAVLGAMEASLLPHECGAHSAASWQLCCIDAEASLQTLCETYGDGAKSDAIKRLADMLKECSGRFWDFAAAEAATAAAEIAAAEIAAATTATTATDGEDVDDAVSDNDLGSDAMIASVVEHDGSPPDDNVAAVSSILPIVEVVMPPVVPPTAVSTKRKKPRNTPVFFQQTR